MKNLLSLIFSLLIAGGVFAAPTEVAPIELTNTAMIDSSSSTTLGKVAQPWVFIPTDGVIFPNDGRTIVYLLCYATSATLTITKAAPTSVYIEGYGTTTIPNLTVSLVAAGDNMSVMRIPINYNVAGKITMTTSAANKIKIKVIKLPN